MRRPLVGREPAPERGASPAGASTAYTAAGRGSRASGESLSRAPRLGSGTHHDDGPVAACGSDSARLRPAAPAAYGDPPGTDQGSRPGPRSPQPRTRAAAAG